MFPKTLAQTLGANIHHHHHKQKQDHHRTDINQHQGDSQKLGLEEHPEHGRLEKRQHQEQRRMNRVARRDHPKRREQKNGRESIKKRRFKIHDKSFFLAASQRYLASAALAAVISLA